MGFSIAAGFAIVATALLATMTSLTLSMEHSYLAVDKGQEAKSELQQERLATDITIVSYSYNATSKELTVKVENTGARSLKASSVDVLVNGQYVQPLAGRSQVEGNGATDIWGAHENLNLTLSVILEPPALSSLKVVSGNGVADLLRP